MCTATASLLQSHLLPPTGVNSDNRSLGKSASPRLEGKMNR
jgi:hypothetical protein